MNNSSRKRHVFQLDLLGSDDGDGMRVMTDGGEREGIEMSVDVGQSELIFSQSAVQTSLGINSKQYLNRKY